MTFNIKKGDLEPDLELQLQDVNRNPFDLTGATLAQVRWKNPNGVVVTRTMSITTPAQGLVVYLWQAGDTDVVGEHTAEVIVTWTGGDLQTFPSKGTFVWTVYDVIA